jgi:hypothetical protein
MLLTQKQKEEGSMKNILMKNILWGLVFVFCAAGVSSAQTLLYFPQFVDGSQGNIYWGTIIEVTNPTSPGSPVVIGSISLNRETGAVMDLTFTDENGQPTDNTFQLAGGQTKFFFSPKVTSTGVVPYNVGYATVTANLPILGNLIFLEGNASGPFALAGVPASASLNRQVIFANANTGIALLNAGTLTANLTLQYLDKSGAQIGQVTRTLTANNHTSFFISQLFPNAPSTAVGTLRITSDQAVVATALLFNGAAFGTIPVLPLQ